MTTRRDDLDNKIDVMELEMLNKEDENEKKDRDLKDILEHYVMYGRYLFDKFMTLIRLYYQLYPKIMMGIAIVLGCLLIKILFFRHRGKTLYVHPYLVNHYGNIESYYDLKIGKIDHWCLQGGNEGCWCEDPTVPQSKEENRRWMTLHEKNKRLASNAPRNLDVVFLGDQFVQAWTGEFLNGPIFGAKEIQTAFNTTFHKADGGRVEGIALGIDGDTTENLLWRIQNGEMPKTLKPKVWWLQIGANDLAITQCSEEVIIIGMLRLADEIKFQHPDSVVVIQGILPRSSQADGHVRTIPPNSSQASKTLFHNKNKKPKKEYVKVDEYPLWPSIQLINDELSKFCATHEHLVFFDATDIFFGSLGNAYFVAPEKVLIKELFKNDYATPSTAGFKVLAKVIGREVVRIVENKDESNHKVTADEVT